MPAIDDAIDSILLPTDGSDGALAGAKRGLDVAVAAGADVHVLSVADTTDLEGISGLLETDVEEQRAAIEAEAEAAVETVATIVRERYQEADLTTATERGVPYREIQRYVDENGIDAIAMGTKGSSGLDRVLLGSVAENVLRTVDVPVLAVPPEAGSAPLVPEAVENVLLPTDGSDAAAIAIGWGVGLADAFDASVHAVYSANTSGLTGGTEPSEILSALEETGEEALQTVRERAKAAGVTVTGTVASGPPVRVILDYADENEIDLLVVGTHGRSGVERQLLGSVTENVLRNADLPVWCVPVEED